MEPKDIIGKEFIGVRPQSIQTAVSKNRSCKQWKNFKLIEIVKKK